MGMVLCDHRRDQTSSIGEWKAGEFVNGDCAMKDGFKWTGAKGAKGYQVSSPTPILHVTNQGCSAQVGTLRCTELQAVQSVTQSFCETTCRLAQDQ